MCWWLLSLVPLTVSGYIATVMVGQYRLEGSVTRSFVLMAMVLAGGALAVLVCVYFFRLFLKLARLGHRLRKRRLSRMLVVNTAGIEVRVRDQRWYYRWSDVSRVTEQRRHLRRHICLEVRSTAILPPARRPADLGPWYDPRRGEVLLTTLSGFREGRREITKEIAACAGTKWTSS